MKARPGFLGRYEPLIDIRLLVVRVFVCWACWWVIASCQSWRLIVVEWVDVALKVCGFEPLSRMTSWLVHTFVEESCFFPRVTVLISDNAIDPLWSPKRISLELGGVDGGASASVMVAEEAFVRWENQWIAVGVRTTFLNSEKDWN